MTTPFDAIDPGHISLLSGNGMPEAAHLWKREHLDALIGAYVTHRPLLLRGEAGSGKSQIARAAANELKAALFKVVIHARFEAKDLLYRVDTLQRLADAQSGESAREKVENLSAYVRPGKLHQALAACQPGQPRPVLLIDEIDKADPDVPNAMLDVLSSGSFDIEETGQRVESASGALPLIVFTTNEERELPAAFVRRCVVLNLNPPADDTAFLNWLLERASAHARLKQMDPEVMREAAVQTLQDRKAAKESGPYSLGLAEYLDLLLALVETTQGLANAEQRKAAQAGWLKRLRPYFLVKGADLQQAALLAASQAAASEAHG